MKFNINILVLRVYHVSKTFQTGVNIGGGGEGWGGDEVSYYKPPKICKPEILDPPKILGIKIAYRSTKTRKLKCLNTDLFNQTDHFNA